MTIFKFSLFLSTVSVILLSCESQRSGTNVSLNQINRYTTIVSKHIVPLLTNLDQSKKLPGNPNLTDANVGLRPGLCSVSHIARVNRIILDLEPENLSTQGEFRYVFTKPKPSNEWKMKAAWNTKQDGTRTLFELHEASGFTEAKANQFVNSPEKLKLLSSITAQQPTDTSVHYINTNKYKDVEQVFLGLAKADLLPGVSKKEWSMYDPVPVPKRLEKDDQFRYAEFMITLKDGSAEYFYIFKRGKVRDTWDVSSVLKLNADGSATMLPVK